MNELVSTKNVHCTLRAGDVPAILYICRSYLVCCWRWCLPCLPRARSSVFFIDRWRRQEFRSRVS